jgi:hypothetical protein
MFFVVAMTWTLGGDMSNETHMTHGKLLIDGTWQTSGRVTYFEIWAKLKDLIFENKNLMIKFKLDENLRTKYNFLFFYFISNTRKAKDATK